MSRPVFFRWMPRNREPPLGVKILSILAGLGGAALILLTLSIAALDPSSPQIIGMYSLLFSGFGFLGIGYLAYAWGLWNLRRWAWWVAEILGVIAVAVNLSSTGSTFSVFMLLWNGAVIIYLWQRRTLFGIKKNIRF